MQQQISMKAGAINLVTTPGDGFTSPNSPLERIEHEHKLRSTLDPRSDGFQTSLDGPSFAEGTIYREELVDIKTKRITETGKLEVDEERKERQINETPFLYIKGEAWIPRSTGSPAARNIFEQITGSNIMEARIDTESFAREHSEATLRDVIGPDTEGQLSSIRASGPNAGSDSLTKRIGDSRVQTSYENLEWRDRRLYMTLTKSGYVEIYRDQSGGDITSSEFAHFIVDEVLPHAYIPDE
ncbi:hypothetical protein G9C85_02550 [Halorubellus sp. JP-L1]|uniref:hypothetical protein n=1 Tax=Halorubellus sp. JP-L1 TaxID=2715753 RepID=UPI001409F514|nr:hypothetical protein [Halorubellus sp. JP-L1]NHN40518.1 hypothetical protein [Halorubellus sp. JP-L1]